MHLPVIVFATLGIGEAYATKLAFAAGFGSIDRRFGVSFWSES